MAIAARPARVSSVPGSTDLPVTASKPQILVLSQYDPLNPADVARTPSNIAPLAPDIILQGDVSNLRGLVKIDSAAGSIRLEQKRNSKDEIISPAETATIRADQVEVKTRNGDFVQSYTDSFFHVAGAPLTIVPGDTNLAFPGNVDSIIHTPETAGSGIVANGSVLIAARYLNINGIIQSGISEWGVRIPANAGVTVPGLTIRSVNKQVELNLGETIVVALHSTNPGKSKTKVDAAAPPGEPSVTLFTLTPSPVKNR